jgi:hypothetical protein
MVGRHGGVKLHGENEVCDKCELRRALGQDTYFKATALQGNEYTKAL